MPPIVDVKGFVSISLLDYPGRISSVLFAGGCDFRCPYCYNTDLVLNPQEIPTIPEEELLEDISKRLDSGLIDGVVVTGGEPTLSPDLPRLLRVIKSMGASVKLDTNGTRPQLLEAILRRNLTDYVAMDYKAPLGRYSDLAGVNVDTEAIRLSAQLLLGGKIDYEFRTTVHPGLLDVEDLLQIIREIKGAKRYAVQPFHAV